MNANAEKVKLAADSELCHSRMRWHSSITISFADAGQQLAWTPIAIHLLTIDKSEVFALCVETERAAVAKT